MTTHFIISSNNHTKIHYKKFLVIKRKYKMITHKRLLVDKIHKKV